MELEDNDSSGSSVNSDHIPAKRLRSSIVTRSSRTTPVSEGSIEVDAHQGSPSTTHDDTPVPSNPDHEPGIPDANTGMNAPLPSIHSDLMRNATFRATPTPCSSDPVHMDVDEPGAGLGAHDAVSVDSPHVRELATILPATPSQPSPSSGPVPCSSELGIPDFLMGKNDVYSYLSSIDEPGFKALLKTYIIFELADHSRIRGTLSTTYRPKAITWWTGRARPAKLPPFDSLKSFTNSITQWWIFIQPTWREIKSDKISRTTGDWERLYQPGINGLLNVVVLAYWWARILAERDSPVDSVYSWFVSDVTWVLTQLTSVARDNLFDD